MSTFVINHEAADDEPIASLTDLRVVDDGGSFHLEGVFLAGDLVKALPEEPRSDSPEPIIDPVANIRPEHTLVTRRKNGEVVYREGTMEVKPGKQRAKIERWTRQLINEALEPEQRDPQARRAAVLGNLSIRLHPKFLEDGRARLYDRDGRVLQLSDLRTVSAVDLELYGDARFDTGVDSLSRLKAVYKAEQAVPGSVARRRTASRIWISDDEDAAAVAHAYNQEGDPVNATAAKYRHQDAPAQIVARWLMDRSHQLGAKNVEVLTNRVSANSNKLTSFNTLSLALEHFWSHAPFDVDEPQIGSQADYLVRFWDALVAARPEFGYAAIKQRQEWRKTTLAGSALSIHGAIAIAAALYPSENFLPLTKLASLVPLVSSDGTPVLDGGGDQRFIDFFSYENPTWQDTGVLVKSKEGGLTLRMSFQTRKAMADEMRKFVGAS